MLTEDMAKVEMSTGLCAVCSWCEHWHESKDKWSTVKCGQNCGGLTRHPPMAFPKYKGPWQNNIHKMCFICGVEPVSALEIRGQGFLGMCAKHIDTAKKILKDVTGKYPIIQERVVFAPAEKRD